MAKSSTIMNLAKLDKKLKRLPAAVTAEIRAAMEKQADEIVRLARSLVPKDTHELENSIGWTWGSPPRGSLTLGKVVKANLGKQLTLTIYAGNDKAYYARWVEFGTKASPARESRRNANYKRTVVMTKAYGAHAATPAQPFFFPAYRAKRKAAKAAIRKATNLAGKKVASGK